MAGRSVDDDADEFGDTSNIEVETVDLQETVTMIRRGKKFHFYPKADIMLLRQVVADRPFDAAHGTAEEAWAAVAKKLKAAGVQAEGRAIRERFALLMRRFKGNEMDSLRSSGIDEEYEEREVLLTEIAELLEDKKKVKTEKKMDETVRAVLGNKLRDDALLTLREKSKAREAATTSDNATAPSKKRLLSTVFAERADRREKELEIERVRAQNKTKKLELKEKKMDMKKKKQESQAELQKAQLQMFAALCSKLTATPIQAQTSANSTSSTTN